MSVFFQNVIVSRIMIIGLRIGMSNKAERRQAKL